VAVTGWSQIPPMQWTHIDDDYLEHRTRT